jgi:hypothetical protein
MHEVLRAREVRWSRWAALGALTLLTMSTAHARADESETVAPEPQNDFLFPGGGRVSFTGTTGLPYSALGELSIGIGDRVALGGFVAGGPFGGGVATGINPRADVAHIGCARLVLEAPFVWYPDLENTDNWVLARPDVRFEAAFGRLRVHVSAGAMGAKMLGAARVQGPIAAYGGRNGLPSGVQQGAIWNTAGTGVALALSARTSLFAEGFLILRGARVAGPEWFALPLAAFLGVSTTL